MSLSLSLSLALGSMLLGGASTPEVPAATVASISQLADANRVNQRNVYTGGSFGKGWGDVLVTMNVTSHGKIWARTRDASNNVTQAKWLAVLDAPIGNGPVTVSGVEGRPNAYKLDISTDDGQTWFLGTVLQRMGDLGSGYLSQSYIQNWILNPYVAPNAENDLTIAGAGLTVDPNTWCLIGSATAWEQPADGNSRVNSVGIVRFMNLMAQELGVAFGFVGYAVSGTSVTQWNVGGTNQNLAEAKLATAGNNVRFPITMIGHTDMTTTPYPTYVNQMDDWTDASGVLQRGYLYRHKAIYDHYNALNTHPTPTRLVGTVPSPAGATSALVELLNRAMSDQLAVLGAVSMNDSDGRQMSDGSHRSSLGMIYQAEAMARACLGDLASSPTLSLTMTRGTPSGGNVPLYIPISVEAGYQLSLSGDIKALCRLWRHGDRAPANLVTINSAALAGDMTSGYGLALNVFDPGDVPLQLMYGAFVGNSYSAGLDQRANQIFDNNTHGGLFPSGRALKASVRPSVYKPASATLGVGTPTFSAAGQGPYGGTSRSLNGGWGITPFWPLPDYTRGMSLSFQYKHKAAGLAFYLMGSAATGFSFQVQVQANGDIKVSTSSSASQTILASNLVLGWNQIDLCWSPARQLLRYYVNGVLVVTADNYSSIAIPQVNLIAIGGAATAAGTGITGSTIGTAPNARGELADILVQSGMRPPVVRTAMATGTEPGALYRMPLQSDGSILLS